MNPQRIYSVLDRLAHHSTTGDDLDNTVAGLRRLLNGESLSEVLRSCDPDDSTIDRLREELAAMMISERESHEQIVKLTKQLSRLQNELGQKPNVSCEFYTYDEIIQAMIMKFGKHHGVPAALCERNARLPEEGQNIPPITVSGFQQWRRNDRYPAHVIDQIKAMSCDDLLSRRKWTEIERKFLTDLYNTDPKRTNQYLAKSCSTQFGRLVTECSIRGELDRLRQRGVVCRYRRSSTTVA